jgi:hypothetical protein
MEGGGGLDEGAGATLDPVEERADAREGIDLRPAEGPQDAEDLLVLPPLEQGRRDQHLEHGARAPDAERGRADRELAHARPVAEHLRASEVVGRAVVAMQVPLHDGLHRVDLRGVVHARHCSAALPVI